QMVELHASGTTCLGAALKLLAQSIDQEVAQTTVYKKGDWKPLVFIMTDGVPTDDWEEGLRAFRSRKTGYTLACAAGDKADERVLKAITNNVVRLDNADSQTISKFFQWVTASISVSSTKVEERGTEVGGMSELPPPPPELNIVV
ncbi:MAG: tellurium resistance protein TerY, partial [Sphingobacteriales bacterium]